MILQARRVRLERLRVLPEPAPRPPFGNVPFGSFERQASNACWNFGLFPPGNPPWGGPPFAPGFGSEPFGAEPFAPPGGPPKLPDGNVTPCSLRHCRNAEASRAPFGDPEGTFVVVDEEVAPALAPPPPQAVSTSGNAPSAINKPIRVFMVAT